VIGNSLRQDRSRTVLSASSTGAPLLLFIDDDLLSYLELAPTEEDGSFDEFRAAELIEF
jgi:hypothetical protein